MSPLLMRAGAAAWVLLYLAGCATAAPAPSVNMVHAPGKPPDLFAAEDEACREEAQASVDEEDSTRTVVGSAVVGTVLGAALGSVFSGPRHRQDHAQSGAVAGLVLGTAAGLSRSAAANQAERRQYEVVYERCMLAKGNQFPGTLYRQAPPPPPAPGGATPYYPPPPPAPR